MSWRALSAGPKRGSTIWRMTWQALSVRPSDAARMQEVRRAYQRAVSVPTHSIDALYREYDAFEHGRDS